MKHQSVATSATAAAVVAWVVIGGNETAVHQAAWYWWLAGGALGSVGLALGATGLRRAGDIVMSLPARAFGVASVVIAAALYSWAAIAIFDGIPRAQDEVNYFFQAKIFASGHLWMNSHPLREFFSYRFFVNDGRFYSLFQPGWPALLTVGHSIGAPWLVGPAAGAALVGFTYGASRRVFDEATGRLTTLLMLCSPVVLLQSASMLSHAACAALSVAALYLALRYRERPHGAWLFGAGACLGFMFVVRAATAAALSLPLLGLVAVWTWRGRARVRDAAWMVAGGLFFGGLQLAYNAELSGSAWTFPQARYFAMTEPTPDCHRLGIGDGIGCLYEHGPDLGPDGFTWRRALEVSGIRIGAFRWDLFGTGIGIFLVLMPFLTRRVGRQKWWIFAFPASLISIYLFYYYHGNLYGARYYFEVVPYCMMLIAAGWLGLLGAAEDAEATDVLRWPGAGTLLTMAIVPAWSLANDIPRKWAKYGSVWVAHRAAHRHIPEAPAGSVVIVPGGDRHYWAGFAINDADLSGDIVVALDLGEAANAQLKTFYPDRELFRFLPDEGRLSPLHLAPSPQRIVAEGEAKFPPTARHGGWARPQTLEQRTAGRSSRVGQQLFFDAKSPGAYFEVAQYVFEPGEYRLELAHGVGPDYGRVAVSMDGIALDPRIEGYSSAIRIRRWRAGEAIHLEPGMHQLRFTIIGRHDASAGLASGLDQVILQKVEWPSPPAMPPAPREDVPRE